MCGWIVDLMHLITAADACGRLPFRQRAHADVGVHSHWYG
jgi:hypothetical protein